MSAALTVTGAGRSRLTCSNAPKKNSLSRTMRPPPSATYESTLTSGVGAVGGQQFGSALKSVRRKMYAAFAVEFVCRRSW